MPRSTATCPWTRAPGATRLVEEGPSRRDPAEAVERLLDLAAADLRLGHANAAMDACYTALSLDPDHVVLHLALVQLYEEQGMVRACHGEARPAGAGWSPWARTRKARPSWPRRGSGAASRVASTPLVGVGRERGRPGARCYTRLRMLPFVDSILRQITPTSLLDIAITALFIYWLFSLIRGTRAVTLVLGVSILLGVYALAQFLELRLFTQLLQTGAVVGLFALVVVFQPELRRVLERIGRVGTFSWLLVPPHSAGSSTSPRRSPGRREPCRARVTAP